MSLWDSLFGGGGDGTQAQATPSAGLLDPRAIRQQAMWQGLGALSAGLLAAGQQRPASQPSPLPQALLAFPQGYNQGIQSGIQSAALDTQALDQQRMNALRASDQRYANLPTAALIAQASRAQARPMADADSVRIFGTTGGVYDPNNVPRLPEGPRTAQLTSAATTQGRVGVEGYGIPQVGYLPPSAFAPGASTPAPGAIPQGRVAPTPAPGAASRTQPVGGAPGAPTGSPLGRAYTADDIIATDPSLSRPQAEELARSANEAYGVGPAAAGAPQMAQAQPPQGRSGAPMPRSVPVPGMPGAQMIVPANPADTAESTAAAQARVQYAREQLAPQIQGATRILQGTAELRRIAADPNMRMGPGGGVANYAAEWLRFVGADGLAGRVQSPDFASLQGMSAQQIVAQIGGSLGTGVSNADVALIGRQVPNPLQSRESFERFVNLLEGRAQNNLVSNHAAYAGSMPGYSPQTDPVTIQTSRQLQATGIDPTILFKDPTRGVPAPRRAPEQSGAAAMPRPTVAPGGPNGQVALPPPPAQAGMTPPARQPATGAAGSATNPIPVPTTRTGSLNTSGLVIGRHYVDNSGTVAIWRGMGFERITPPMSPQ